MKCVVCGKDADSNHKCDESLIKRIETLRANAEDRKEREVWYGTRLCDGYAMLNGRAG
jgi:hypothetical protein